MRINLEKMDHFVKRTHGKQNIFCFGAGNVLAEFLAEFAEYHIEKDIKYIVDNSPEKQGKEIQCADKKIVIISPEKMFELISDEDILLISTIRFSEIIEQLSGYRALEHLDCYICYFLRMIQNDLDRDQVVIPDEFCAEKEICIPKVIHYCWFGGNEIPKQNQVWMESWKKYCPDYEIMEWNEKNYDVSKNLYMKQAYDRGKWAFVSDYARMDIIERYGGVYLDTDVELLKNIDPLLSNQAFCGFESRRYVAFGLGFGAVKGHPIISRLREDYEKRRFQLENGSLNETACPVYQTELLEEYGLKRNGEFQKLKDITVYPERVLCGLSSLSFRMTKKPEDTYSIHHFAASWVGEEERHFKERIIQSICEVEKE